MTYRNQPFQGTVRREVRYSRQDQEHLGANLAHLAAYALNAVSELFYARRMDKVDATLLRAWTLAVEDITDAVEAEFAELLPPLIEAGYVHEEPWGADYEESEGWALWRFTQAGIDRAKALEANDRAS